jgi:hypothetical protein
MGSSRSSGWLDEHSICTLHAEHLVSKRACRPLHCAACAGHKATGHAWLHGCVCAAALPLVRYWWLLWHVLATAQWPHGALSPTLAMPGCTSCTLILCPAAAAAQDAQHHRQDGAYTAEVLPAAPGAGMISIWHMCQQACWLPLS